VFIKLFCCFCKESNRIYKEGKKLFEGLVIWRNHKKNRAKCARSF